MGLSEILHLPNISRDSVHLSGEVLLLDHITCDLLELLHLRCGHVSKSNCWRHIVICYLLGVVSSKHLSKRFMKSVSGNYVSDVRRQKSREDHSN